MTAESPGAAGDRAAIGAAAPTPGPRAARTRSAVLDALAASSAVRGVWEAGSASFGRADDASDLDVCVLCADGCAPDVLDAIGAHVDAIGDQLAVWDRGLTTFGLQRFWHPVPAGRAPRGCTLDVTVIELDAQRDRWRELLQPERHGRALVLHDPEHLMQELRAAARFDVDAHRARMRTDLEQLRGRRIFGEVVTKELARGRELDACMMYHGMVAMPLVTLLGMLHRPLRFDFGERYLHEELPGAVVERLVPLVRPARGDLSAALVPALAWIDELLDQLDIDALPIEQHAAQMRAAFG